MIQSKLTWFCFSITRQSHISHSSRCPEVLLLNVSRLSVSPSPILTQGQRSCRNMLVEGDLTFFDYLENLSAERNIPLGDIHRFMEHIQDYVPASLDFLSAICLKISDEFEAMNMLILSNDYLIHSVLYDNDKMFKVIHIPYEKITGVQLSVGTKELTSKDLSEVCIQIFTDCSGAEEISASCADKIAVDEFIDDLYLIRKWRKEGKEI